MGAQVKELQVSAQLAVHKLARLCCQGVSLCSPSLSESLEFCFLRVECVQLQPKTARTQYMHV